jgi:uncharacterized protein
MRPFWEGCGRGELRAQQCRTCRHLRFPPSEVCPRCLGDEADWTVTTGRGEVETFVVFHHAYHPAWAEQVPYNVVLVQLDDGPRMFANLLGGQGRPTVGQRVRAVFERTAEHEALPQFEAEGP